MDASREALESFILNPAYHDILVLVKAIRNGIVYGSKVRFPHALVMTVLFRSGTVQQKIQAIYKATKQHAKNLATFAFTYKLIMLVLKKASQIELPINSSRTGRPLKLKARESSVDSFWSGLVAGYYVFGTPAAGASAVNQQIVVYVFARVCLGLAKLAVTARRPSPTGYQAGYSVKGGAGGGLIDMILGSPLFGRMDEAAQEEFKKKVARNSWAVFASVSWAMVMWLFRWHPDVLQPSLRSSMKYLYDNAENWDGLRNFIWHNV